jgi:hypothetical protein
MIGLEELAFVNETIKCLGYKTMKYKANPYVHHNWIFNTIYPILEKLGLETLLQISFHLETLITNYYQLQGLRHIFSLCFLFCKLYNSIEKRLLHNQ